MFRNIDNFSIFDMIFLGKQFRKKIYHLVLHKGSSLAPWPLIAQLCISTYFSKDFLGAFHLVTQVNINIALSLLLIKLQEI